jgi:acetyl esterase/lipase
LNDPLADTSPNAQRAKTEISMADDGSTASALANIHFGRGSRSLEENLIFSDRLSRAGVPVELRVYPRAYHGFYRATNARVTRQAEHDTREALRRFLHG